MQPDDKQAKRGTIQSFFRSSPKKKKVDITTSAIDTFSKIISSDEAGSYSTDTSLKLASSFSPISSSTSSPSPSTALP